MMWFRLQIPLMVAQCVIAIYLNDMINKPLNKLLSYYKQDIDQRHKNTVFNPQAAKNVILFLVEGLDAHTMSAARQIVEAKTTPVNNYMAALDYFLSGHLKPSSRDFIVADPAAAVSAIFNGLPEYNGQMGWVEQEEATCLEFDKSKKLLKNLFKVMSDAGKHTALLTTSRLTSPGVAGTYASTPDMQIESDIHLAESGCNDGKFKDIAVQLIKDYKNINILIGRGRQYFMKSGSQDQTTNNSPFPWRSDMDLKTVWAMEKVLRKKAHKDATGTQAVMAALKAQENLEYFLGFLDENYQADLASEDLQEMITLIVNALNKRSNSQGYFLTIYDNRLADDHVSNAINVGRDLNNLLKAINYLDTVQTRADDTLILLASVQGSRLTIGSDRLHEESIVEWMFTESCENEVTQIDYSVGSRSRDNSTVKSRPGATGGPDLPVFARGPGAQAFTGINDFAYLYHALIYATCATPDATKNWQHCASPITPTPLTTTNSSPTPGTNTAITVTVTQSTTSRPNTQRPLVWPWLPQPLPQQSENPYNSLGIPYHTTDNIDNQNPYGKENPNSLSNINSNPDKNPTLTQNPNTHGNPRPLPNVNPNPGRNPTPGANAGQNPNEAQNPWSWASLFPFFI